MLTTGFKLYLGYFFGAVAAAVVFGYTTGGNHLGPLTAGYKGAVGDHLGYTVLLVTGLLAGAMAVMMIAFRDAGAAAAAELLGVGIDTVPVQRPVQPSYWPLISAFGVGTTVIGLVVSSAVFIAGLVILAVVVVEWAMQAWADRATGDPEVNRELRDRIMNPIELPVGAALAIVAVPLAASRLFLTSSKFGAVWVATGIAAVIFIAAVVIALRPRLSRNVVAGLVLVGGIALIGGGIIAAVVGQRDFHHGGEEGTEQGEGH
jgi:hypothetical protein